MPERHSWRRVRCTPTGPDPGLTSTGKGGSGTLDLHLQDNGATLSSTSKTASVEVIVIGKESYFKFSGTDASKNSFGSVFGKKFDGKWIKSSDNSDNSDNLTLASFAKQLAKPDSGGSIEQKVTRTTLGDRKVVLLTGTKGEKIWVAATGTPYPVQLYIPKSDRSESSSSAGLTEASSGPATITLNEFGQRVTLKAPKDAVDIADLGKGLGFPDSSPTPS